MAKKREFRWWKELKLLIKLTLRGEYPELFCLVQHRTSLLKSREPRQKMQYLNNVIWKEFHWPLLTSKMERTMSQGMQTVCRSWKIKTNRQQVQQKKRKKDCLLESPTGMQPCWHVYFSPVSAVLNLWTTELWDSKLTLFVLSHKVYDILIQHP